MGLFATNFDVFFSLIIANRTRFNHKQSLLTE